MLSPVALELVSIPVPLCHSVGSLYNSLSCLDKVGRATRKCIFSVTAYNSHYTVSIQAYIVATCQLKTSNVRSVLQQTPVSFTRMFAWWCKWHTWMTNWCQECHAGGWVTERKAAMTWPPTCWIHTPLPLQLGLAQIWSRGRRIDGA